MESIRISPALTKKLLTWAIVEFVKLPGYKIREVKIYRKNLDNIGVVVNFKSHGKKIRSVQSTKGRRKVLAR